MNIGQNNPMAQWVVAQIITVMMGFASSAQLLANTKNVSQ